MTPGAARPKVSEVVDGASTLPTQCHDDARGRGRERPDEQPQGTRSMIPTPGGAASSEHLSQRLAAALTRDEVAVAAVEEAVRSLGACSGQVGLLDADGFLRLVHVVGTPPEFRMAFGRMPLDAPQPATAVLGSGAPLVLASDADWAAFPAAEPLRRAMDVSVLAAVPLKAAGSPVGVLSVTYAGPSSMPPEDHRLLVDIAERCSGALDRVEVGDQQQRLARTLQLAVDAARLGTFDYDLRTGRIERSPHHLAIYGIAPGTEPRDLRAWEAMLHPDDLPRMRQVVQRAQEDLQVFEAEYRVRRADGEERRVLVRGQAFADVEGRPTRLSGVVLDVTEQVATRRRTELLQELTARLARVLDRRQIAAIIATEVRQALDACAATVSEIDAQGRASVLAATGAGSAGAEECAAPADSGPLLGEVLRSGGPVFLDSPADWARLPGSGAPDADRQAWAGLPLLMEDHLIGVATFGWRQPRQFDSGEQDFLEAVAGQCAVALDRARLFEAERASRAAAEASRARLALLAEAGAAFGASLDADEVLRRLASLVAASVADVCVVLLPDEQGHLARTHIRAAEGRGELLAGDLRRSPPLDPNSNVPAAIAYRTRTPQLTPAMSADDVRVAGLPAQLAGTSAAAAPLLSRGRVLGLVVASRGPGSASLTSADRDLLADLASRAGVALDNARLLASRTRVAAQLQDSLLPDSLPAVPGVELAARYVAAEQAADVGGDFYDAFPLAPDEYAVVIGDVAGRGVEAAGLTGLARTALRALGADVSPAAALARLNELLVDRTGPERFLTVAYVRLRLRSDGSADVVISNAGHPPPLRLGPGRTVSELGGSGMLLGVTLDARLTEERSVLEPGQTLLFYTDGVIEARGRSGMFGEGRLADVAADAAGTPADGVVRQVVRAVLDYRTGGADDLAVLALRLRPARDVPDVTVDVQVPADRSVPSVIRQRLRTEFAPHLPRERLDELLLAVTEVLSNAIRQTRKDPGRTLRPDPIRVRVERRPGVLRVEIANPGLGFVPPSGPPDPEAERGRGLTVVRALCRRFSVETAGEVTAVSFELPDR